MSVAPDRVCVVIGRTRHKMVQAELQEAVKRGAKFLELRLDFLSKAVDFKRLAPLKACPWICTVRRPKDGGRWAGPEDERLVIIRQAIVSGVFDWVDLETDIADGIPRFGKVQRVVSYHNTTHTPHDLEAIYAAMCKQTADVIKIAVMAQSPEDCRRVMEIQKSATKPTLAFCMGDVGFPTRLAGLKYGAPWVYAAFNRERGVAPGMPTLDDLRTTYPVRTIDKDTKIYGLFGDPVGHSYSPILHNHMYRRLGVNAVYLPFRVPAGQLSDAVTGYECFPVNGYSVTIPHKQAAEKLAAEKDAVVTITGATNTLVRRPDGRFAAFNTDAPAIVDSLKAHLAERDPAVPPPQLNQLFFLILGAGGAARAAAHALHREGAHVSITARDLDKATRLAEEVQCKVVDWNARHATNPCDVLINCTPVGMAPNVDEMPVHVGFLKPGLTVFDTVYSPENTLLVREAKARSCHIVTGVDMFVRQAARQIGLFTGQSPPIDDMRKLLRKAMSPVTHAVQAVGEDDPDEDGDDE